MALRRDLERRVVLAEAVAEMRRQGHTECELENLLIGFKGIQVTLAVMARAIIHGRIDSKTAGRLVVHLQTMSKLLWLYHRGHRRTQREKGLTTKDTKGHEGSKSLPRINTDDIDLEGVSRNNAAANSVEETRKEAQKAETGEVVASRGTEHPQLMVVYDRLRSAIHGEGSQAALAVKARMFLEGHRGWRDGPYPLQQTRAA